MSSASLREVAQSTFGACAVGLRNVVAHGYAGIDPASVHAAATAGVADLNAFATEVAAWMTGRP